MEISQTRANFTSHSLPSYPCILGTQETSVGTHYCYSEFPESIRIQCCCFICSGFDQIYKDICPQMQIWLCGTCYARPKFGFPEPLNTTCSSKANLQSQHYYNAIGDGDRRISGSSQATYPRYTSANETPSQTRWKARAVPKVVPCPT